MSDCDGNLSGGLRHRHRALIVFTWVERDTRFRVSIGVRTNGSLDGERTNNTEISRHGKRYNRCACSQSRSRGQDALPALDLYLSG